MNSTTDELIKDIVNDKTGILKGIEEIEYSVGSIPLHAIKTFGRPVVDLNLEVIVQSNFSGLGIDFFNKNLAQIRSIGEYVERYAATVLPKNTIKKTLLKNKKTDDVKFLDLSTVTRVSENRYKNSGFMYANLNEDYDWVKAYSETYDEDYFVPTDLVYLLPPAENRYPIRDIISTGLATAETEDKAKSSSLLECIERDAISFMWLKKVVFPKLDLHSIQSARVKKIIETIERLGIEITIVNITNDIDVPIYFSIFKQSQIPFISVGASADFIEEVAIEKSLREAAAVYNSAVKEILNGKQHHTIDKLSDISSMDDHSSYYAWNDEIDYDHFLFKGPEIKLPLKRSISNYEQLIRKLKNKKYNVLNINLTPIDLKQKNLYVYKTIVPELLFLELHLPMTECNRIEELSEKFKTEDGINKMIHPFP